MSSLSVIYLSVCAKLLMSGSGRGLSSSMLSVSASAFSFPCVCLVFFGGPMLVYGCAVMHVSCVRTV